ERDIHLVPYRRDYGHGHAGNLACNALVVECPEVLASAAATPHDSDVCVTPACEDVERRTDFLSCTFALYPCWNENKFHVRCSPPDDSNDVVQRRAARARDYRNPAWMARQGALPFRSEQPFCGKPGNCELQCLAPESVALRLHALHNELKVAAYGPDGNLAEGRELHAVVGRRWYTLLVARPHHAPHLRILIAQAEVPVAIPVRLEVRYLAAHPQREEGSLENILYRVRERRHAHCTGGAAPGSFVYRGLLQRLGIVRLLTAVGRYGGAS